MRGPSRALARSLLWPALWIALGVIAAWSASAGSLGEGQLEQAFTRALLGYAIARGLNGAISVAQGTEVAVQPAGVGVNFAPGEILDPINDLIERFSWIMMLAASSLGVQRVLLRMSAWWGWVAALAAIGVAWLVWQAWRTHRAGDRASPAPAVLGMLGRAFIFLLLLRLAMPLVVLGNDLVYRVFLEADYQQASKQLEQARLAIGEINETLSPVSSPADVDEGLIDRARARWRQAVAAVDLQARLDDYRAAAETVSENTLRLIVVFLMQTVVLPLLFLLVAWGLAKRVLRL